MGDSDDILWEDWATLRREFEQARRDCATAFSAILRFVETSGHVAEPELATWTLARERRRRVEDALQVYLQARVVP